jgi:hypothetical protein
MNKYRIKVVITKGESRYFPQERFLFIFWSTIFKWEPYRDGGYDDLELAKTRMRVYILEKNPRVEYLAVEERYLLEMKK